MHDETATLKEVAEKIFDEQYNLKLPEVDQTIALTLEKFKEQHKEYVEETIAYIETRLILSQTVKDEETFNLAIECSVQSLKRVIQREDHYLW